eukprot:10719988-Lingulodinium_polyedra.AAC.1
MFNAETARRAFDRTAARVAGKTVQPRNRTRDAPHQHCALETQTYTTHALHVGTRAIRARAFNAQR